MKRSSKKMLKGKIALVLSLLLLTTLLTGCAQANKTPGTEAKASTEAASTIQKAQKEWVIGFDNFDTAVDYCVDVEESLKREAEKRGVKLVTANCHQDPLTALANVESLLVQNADIIIDSSYYADVGKTMVEKAALVGKKVISLDVEYEGGYYFGCNNLESGKVAGKYAGEKIKKDWKGEIDALVLTYAEHAGEVVKSRVQGMKLGIEEILGKELPTDKVYWFDDKNQPVNTKAIAQDFLTSHPNLKHIVFGCLDDPTALGAVSSIEMSGRDNDVYVISTGADKVFRDNMHKENPPKCWIGSVGYFPEKYGEGLIPMAIDILEGRKVPEKVYMENIMVTPENINEYYPQ